MIDRVFQSLCDHAHAARDYENLSWLGYRVEYYIREPQSYGFFAAGFIIRSGDEEYIIEYDRASRTFFWKKEPSAIVKTKLYLSL